MRTINRWATSVALILPILILLGHSTVSRGQSAGAILQPIAAGDIPSTATTYYYLSDYLNNGGSLGAPWPILKDTNEIVYSLNNNGMVFLVDDTGGTITNDEAAADAIALLLQPQDTFSAHVLGGAMAMDDSPPIPGDGSDTNSGSGYSPMFGGYFFDTNSLWLEITNVLDGIAYLNLHNATNEVYAIWSTTNLQGGWNVESELWPTDTNVMPFTELTLDRQNLFLSAEDWTGVTENGNTVPDWWFWNYFGTTSLYDTNLDVQGNTLLYDYQHGINLSAINFTVNLGNEHFNTTNAVGSFLVTAGAPCYEAVLVDNTNFESAVWTPYDGTVEMNLGSTDGVYQVWMGLKGHAPDSVPTWIGTSVYLDQTPPVLTVTNPTFGTVMQPYIQVQGFANKRLSAVTYDISNAVSVITNVPGTVTGEYLDTNLLEFTTNYFQCYDVQVTNGVNLITIHGTDLAGNTSSTNLSYTLDYTGKTNPPTIAMTWPQGGEDIAQNSITVYGTLSDPTASIWLEATDTNGDSNVISGVVERDGHFWIQNVPLGAGTNWLSLTVQDVVSNTATTNFIVTENNSFGLTVNPVTSDMWEVYSTVSGTVSDSSYTVTVNGVGATVDGSGNWTANNVPNNPGNMATFQVNAVSPGGIDPQAQLTVVKPAAIKLASSIYSDESMGYEYGYPVYTTETWTFTAGGGGHWHSTSDLQPPFPPSSSVEDGQIMPDGSMPYYTYSYNGGSESTVTNAGYTPWLSDNHQQVGSLTLNWGFVQETRNAQASWLLHAGSLGIEGDVLNLFIEFGDGTEEGPSTSFWPGAVITQTAGLSYSNIKDTGKQENEIGNVYLSMHDGETRQSTMTTTRPLASMDIYGPETGKPIHTIEVPAPADSNLYRLNLGVAEHVDLSGMPPDTSWSVTGGGLSNYPDGVLVFTAPSNAPPKGVSVTLTASNNDVNIPINFTVFPPTGVAYGTIIGTNHYPLFEIAVGMTNNVYVAPMNVSLSRVQLIELPTNLVKCTGSFINRKINLVVGAAMLSSSNAMSDRPNYDFGAYDNSIVPGRGDLDVPVFWTIPGSPQTNYFGIIPQYFTLVNHEGDLMLEKYNIFLTRGTNDQSDL